MKCPALRVPFQPLLDSRLRGNDEAFRFPCNNDNIHIDVNRCRQETTMSEMKIEMLADEQALVGEGPVWEPENQRSVLD